MCVCVREGPSKRESASERESTCACERRVMVQGKGEGGQERMCVCVHEGGKCVCVRARECMRVRG